MTKDIKDIPEYGDPETWGLTVDEYEDKVRLSRTGLGDAWQVMRQSDDPELQKELDDTELSALKNRSVKFNKEKKEFRDMHGKKYTFIEKHKTNSGIRKEASKIIKDKSKLDRFMSAPDFETYQTGRAHIRKPMETALDNVIKGTPEVTPIVTPGVNQATAEPKFEAPRDPDLDRGVGSIIEKYLK